MTTDQQPYVGTRVRSRNGTRFVRGAGRYVDDVQSRIAACSNES